MLKKVQHDTRIPVCEIWKGLEKLGKFFKIQKIV